MYFFSRKHPGNPASQATQASPSFHFQIAIHHLTAFETASVRSRLLDEVRLLREAAGVWETLERELDGPLDVHVTGGLMVGETDDQFRRTLDLLETVRYDLVFAAAYSPRPGTPATRLADDVPPAVKRERLNELLRLQEGIGLARNQAWLGREVEVLVDTITAPRSHDHADDGEARGQPTSGGLAGRTRGNKLVHLPAGSASIGDLVTARIVHAGPYALRGLIPLG